LPGGWGAVRAGRGAAALRGGVEGRLLGVELLEDPAKIEMSMPPASSLLRLGWLACVSLTLSFDTDCGAEPLIPAAS
jgi:hypothetical protein